MKKIALFCICAGMILFLFSESVDASLPIHPIPWEFTLEDAELIFYMTPARFPPRDQLIFFGIPEISEERMLVRTGIYCSNTRENIYFIDISANKSSVFISHCGMYIATMQNTVCNFNNEDLGGGSVIWATDTRYRLGREIVRPFNGLVNFFYRGELFRSYTAEDLLQHIENVTWTSAGLFWRYSGSGAFDRDRDFNSHDYTLTITTYEDNTFIFDMRTGDIISGGIPSHSQDVWARAITGAIALASVACVILLTIFIKNKTPQSKAE